MLTVIPVRFKYNPKPYWFKFENCDPAAGDYVLVAKDGGMVVGQVQDPPFEITDEQAESLSTSLKSIVRIANDEDLEELERLDQKGAEAKKVFRELAKKRELDIKPIDVEYLMGADKAIFHFSSEERVDFRELVKDLASRLHIHVDMQQIGVRDEARVTGGLGHCGEVLCCVRFASEFMPVSIRMAKEQDLPLNPTKVSGACGRLMCCLRYEFEAYKEFKARAPKVNAIVDTPAGKAKVVEIDVPRELVKIRMEEGSETFYVPIGGMETDPESDSPRPCRVCEEAFNEHCPMSLRSEKAVLAVKIPEAEEEPEQPKKQEKRKRGKKGKKGASQPEQAKQPEVKRQQGAEREAQAPSKSSKRRRRKSSSKGREGASNTGSEAQAAAPKDAAKPRPGQRSSGVRNPQDSIGGNRQKGEAASKGQAKGDGASKAEGGQPKGGSQGKSKSSRRRGNRKKNPNASGGGTQSAQQKPQTNQQKPQGGAGGNAGAANAHRKRRRTNPGQSEKQ